MKRKPKTLVEELTEGVKKYEAQKNKFRLHLRIEKSGDLKLMDVQKLKKTPANIG